jgi:hypothetical protein
MSTVARVVSMPALEAVQNVEGSDVERRRYQRVKLSLLGRCMFTDRRECPCQLLEISPGDAVFISPLSGTIGERVIAYIDNLGRIEGVILERIEHGFVMTISASPRKRDRLADTLTWLANRHVLDLAEDRRHIRRVPRQAQTMIVLADGTQTPSRVIDMSLSGAAVAVATRPPIGTVVRLGRLRARVVRHFDEGIGVEFMRVISDAAIEQTIQKDFF